MSFTSSLLAFWKVLEESREFTSLGFPSWWYIWFHYRGRLENRLNLPYKVELVSINIFNKSVSFPLSAPYEGMAKGILLDQEYLLIDSLPSPPQRILDLGANIGLGTLFMHCQFPQAQFICIEPDPRNQPLLDQTITLNKVPANVISCAVASTLGKMQLRFGDDPTCSALETSPMHQLDQTVTVEVKTIPEIFNQVGWDYIDLLKIDIEGVEDELLSQNNDWLINVGAIILEIHPNTTPEKILSYIQPFGFNLKRHGDGREPVYIATRS